MTAATPTARACVRTRSSTRCCPRRFENHRREPGGLAAF